MSGAEDRLEDDELSEALFKWDGSVGGWEVDEDRRSGQVWTSSSRGRRVSPVVRLQR